MEVRVKKIVGEQWTCMHKVFSCWDPWHNTVSYSCGTQTSKGSLKSGHGTSHRGQPEHIQQRQRLNCRLTRRLVPSPRCHPDLGAIHRRSVKQPSLVSHVKSGFDEVPTIRVCCWAASGTVPAHGDIGAVSRGQRCHKDSHGQHTELSTRHGSGGSPSSDALSPPVSLHLMASVGIFYVPKH